MSAMARILLADDDIVIRELVTMLLQAEGYQVDTRPDGASAWACLGSDPDYDLILLDRLMPGMDGLAVLRAIKADPRFEHLPVILETGMADHASVREGIEAGAHYYLTKPFQPDVLTAVVRAALAQVFEYRRLHAEAKAAERPFEFLQDGVFHFRSLDEARLLARLLARACPDPSHAVHGLQELMVNAVEHGNLCLSYADKSQLLLVEGWEQEVARRLALPEYSARVVEVRFTRQAGELRFVIRDQGDGFDWRGYLDFAPERAFDLHGRGIAMARKLSFDSVVYQGNGNTVVATIPAPKSSDMGARNSA